MDERITFNPAQGGEHPCIRDLVFWIDSQFSPSPAAWLATSFGVEVHALSGFSLRDAANTLVTAGESIVEIEQTS